eukprot:scaffold292700_cov30-Tisochrysis_lutea.AAC.6
MVRAEVALLAPPTMRLPTQPRRRRPSADVASRDTPSVLPLTRAPNPTPSLPTPPFPAASSYALAAARMRAATTAAHASGHTACSRVHSSAAACCVEPSSEPKKCHTHDMMETARGVPNGGWRGLET